jgi:hypothetical protein
MIKHLIRSAEEFATFKLRHTYFPRNRNPSRYPVLIVEDEHRSHSQGSDDIYPKYELIYLSDFNQ